MSQGYCCFVCWAMEKYRKKTKIKWWIKIARYFGLQYKPSTKAVKHWKIKVHTHSSAVPIFLRSWPLFQPVSPYLVRSLTRLCSIHRLCNRAGHSCRLLTRNKSPSTHWRDLCRLSFVFYRKKHEPPHVTESVQLYFHWHWSKAIDLKYNMVQEPIVRSE